MHRFYFPNDELSNRSEGDVMLLPESLYHQVGNVLRMRRGGSLVLFNGDGSEWIVEIEKNVKGRQRSGVAVKLMARTFPDVELPISVTMAMALTRSDRYELAIAKCTELGAAQFIPLETERVQGGDRTVSDRRRERWLRIAIEATELSGRVVPPVITSPIRLDEALTDLFSTDTPTFFLWERTDQPVLLESLRSSMDLVTNTRSVALVIGPVGGFTSDEARLASSRGACEASLGKLILRTETAAISAMSVVAQLWS